jgi:hypothetical protein
MRRARIPDFLESVANHPRVRPYIGPGDHRVSAGVTWDSTVALEWREGGIVFMREATGVYSGHWVFLPKTPDVVGKAREALRYLFTHTDAQRVTGKTPLELRHARKAAQAAGMRHLFNCDGHSFTELTRDQWLKDEDESHGLG